MTRTSREVHLIHRPIGAPTSDDFKLLERTVPPARDNQVVVQNIAMSVDPYMRLRMSTTPSYAPPWTLNTPMQGTTIGRVTSTARSTSIPVGTTVLHDQGWRETTVIDAADVRSVEVRAGVPLSYYLGVLGLTGLTAYTGLTTILPLQAGEAVYVSAAAGGVGSLAAQFARLLGAERVAGSAGSDSKVRYLRGTLNLDYAYNYRATDIPAELAHVMPDGPSYYFDNVGGPQLQPVLEGMRRQGRVLLCGAIADYNDAGAPEMNANYLPIITRRLTVRGYNVRDHLAELPAFSAVAHQWLADDRLVVPETRFDGLESAVPAFLEMLAGTTTGKTIVQIAHDESTA